MRMSTMVSVIFVLFGIVLSASSARIDTPVTMTVDFLREAKIHEAKMHEPLVQAHGAKKSLMDLSFGADNPVINHHQVKSNVKTSQKRFGIPLNSQGREPSIQAYGLPKRIVEDNGSIERVNFDRVSGLDGKVDKVDLRGGEAGIHAYGLPKGIEENNGFIERFGDINDEKKVVSSSDKIRRTRSTDNGYANNDLIDLEGQEAKVFRPLFVYRQQVADRYRVKPRRNPIYGAYQYGTNRQRNSIQGNQKYY